MDIGGSRSTMHDINRAIRLALSVSCFLESDFGYPSGLGSKEVVSWLKI